MSNYTMTPQEIYNEYMGSTNKEDALERLSDKLNMKIEEVAEVIDAEVRRGREGSSVILESRGDFVPGIEVSDDNIDTSETSDNVDHPKHYNSGKYECIEVMRDVFGDDKVLTFCKLNAFKYLWRTDNKNGLEDIKKAKWYIEEYIDISEKN